MSGLLGISSKFFSEGVHNAIKSVNDSKALAAAVITKSQSDTALVMAASGMLIIKTWYLLMKCHINSRHCTKLDNFFFRLSYIVLSISNFFLNSQGRKLSAKRKPSK